MVEFAQSISPSSCEGHHVSLFPKDMTPPNAFVLTPLFKQPIVPDPVHSELWTYRTLLWIFLLAFAARVAFRCHLGSADFWVNGYGFFFDLAQNIAAGKGIAFGDGPPTANRVPLYPAFLATMTLGHKVFLPVVLSQSLIGAATVLCAALLAGEMFGGAAAVIAAAIAAVYPYSVVHDTALQETSMFTLLTAIAVLLLLRVRRSGSSVTAAWAGLTLGAAVLTRASCGASSGCPRIDRGD
jgi:4-amino-4-deoxy-L-arabinose transferase-like glycosyltransferase